jgi:beta-1,4-mannosyl-glycoprotein beta-1,4-N-acetylglucosaminyltransferase
MKLYDCIIVNDELDLIDLRLREIGHLIDHLVVVEATHDWQQNEKPLWFKEFRHRFNTYHDKIIHVVSDTVGEFPVTEWAQRRAIYEGVKDADMTDLILLSDVDEIPSREFVQWVLEYKPSRPVVAHQFLYYYWVNCRQNASWFGTMAMPRGVGRLDFQRIRDTRNGVSIDHSWSPGGYHLSWLGGFEGVKHKLGCHTVAEDSQLYSNAQNANSLPFVPTPDDEEHIRHCVTTGADLFKREKDYAKKEFVEIQPGITHPVTINDWLEEHPQYKHVEVVV